MSRRKSQRWRKLTSTASLAFILGLVWAPAALAFDIRTSDEIAIGSGQIVDDDLYAFGNTVTIDGTVRGDVVAAGGLITINGTVEGNLIAAGQTIIINGTVRDSVRAAGQAAMLSRTARVGRDVVFAGYSLEQQAGSTVSRDLVLGSYQALLAGSLGRNLSGGVGALELLGTVGGNAELEVGDASEGPPTAMMPPPRGVAIPSVRPGLTVGEGAQIAGKLSYKSRQQFPIRGSVAGGTTWTPQAAEAPAPVTPLAVLADNLRRFVALAIVGLLLLWLAPGWTRRLGDTIKTRPFPSVGWGLVAAAAFFGSVVVYAVGTVALAAAFGAATLGSLTGLVIVTGLLGEAVLVSGFIIYTGFIAQALASYVGGRMILERMRPAWAEGRLAPLILGLVIFVALTAVPILGGIIGLLVALLGLGAAWMWSRDRLTPAPAANPAPPIQHVEAA